MKHKAQIACGLLVVVTAAAIPLFLQHREITRLRADLAKNSPRAKTNPHAAQLQNGWAGFRHFLAGQNDVNFLHSMMDYVDNLDAPGARAILDELAKQPLTGKNQTTINLLIDRLVHLDPDSALEWANTVPNAHGRQQMLNMLFYTWSNIDPAKALASLDGISNPSQRVDLTGVVLNNMIISDPQGAIKALGTLPAGGPQTTKIYSKVFESWANEDPVAAAKAALQLPATRDRNYAIFGLARNWAFTDPQAALAWSGNVPAGDMRNRVINSAVTYLAQLDPKAALDYVANVTSTPSRQELTLAVATQWGKDDPQAALAWVEQSATGQTRDTAIQNLMDPLSQVNPAAAVTMLKEIPDGPLHDTAVSTIAQNWAQQNPQEALDWVHELPPSTSTRNVLIKTINDWASNDPDAAGAYAQNLLATDPDVAGRLLSSVASNRESVDPEAALAWAKALPADAGQSIAVGSVIVQMTNTDPQKAWSLGLEFAPYDSTDRVLSGIAEKWAAIDPSQTAAAITSLPAGATLNTITSNLANTWLKQDPMAASQWINTLPAGDARDAAVAQLIAVEGRNDLSTAFNWALSINNPAAQSHQLSTVAEQWAKKDPAGAAAAVQNLTLTNEQRMQLIETINQASTQKR